MIGAAEGVRNLRKIWMYVRPDYFLTFLFT